MPHCSLWIEEARVLFKYIPSMLLEGNTTVINVSIDEGNNAKMGFKATVDWNNTHKMVDRKINKISSGLR